MIRPIIYDSCSSDAQKYLALHDVVCKSTPEEARDLDSSIKLLLDDLNELASDLRHLLTMIRIAIALSFGPSGPLVESLFDDISLSSDFNKHPNSSNGASRIIFNDLLTDYQYLFKTITDNYKIIDLVNKKIVLLGSFAGSSDQDLQSIGSDIYRRVIEYLLISGYDFRKQNLFNHLNEELGILSGNFELDELTRAMFKLSLERKTLVPFEQFTRFVSNCSRFIKQLNHNKLVEFYIENNLAILPSFYKSVHISKISNLFGSPPTLDYEKLISRMITNDNLPFGTTIDQERQLVIFPGAKKDYDDYDSKVHNVFRLVESIADKIEV